jgi:2Fe-2S ferredoxin
MPTIHLIHPDSHRTTLQAPTGTTLMRAAVDGGVDGIVADCGGTLTCATCHVHIAPDWLPRLPAPSADEDAMLDMTATPRQPDSRLSCQVVIDDGLDGLEVVLPASQY